MRAAVVLMAFFLWLVRCDFRPYVHDPVCIHAWIAAQGFHKRYEGRTAVWLTRVYVRSDRPGAAQTRCARFSWIPAVAPAAC